MSSSTKADVAAWSMLINQLDLIKQSHSVLVITGN